MYSFMFTGSDSGNAMLTISDVDNSNYVAMDDTQLTEIANALKACDYVTAACEGTITAQIGIREFRTITV